MAHPVHAHQGGNAQGVNTTAAVSDCMPWQGIMQYQPTGSQSSPHMVIGHVPKVSERQ